MHLSSRVEADGLCQMAQGEADLRRVREGDVYGLDHLLLSFGGMGSLDDLVICEHNGHDVRPEEERTVNERLRRLREIVHHSAIALRSGDASR
jgi:hypothetical protein